MTIDIVDRLRLDPGQRTLGQLLQDREAALHEILRLRKPLGSESREARQPRTTAEDGTRAQRLPDPAPARPAGTLLRRKEWRDLRPRRIIFQCRSFLQLSRCNEVRGAR